MKTTHVCPKCDSTQVNEAILAGPASRLYLYTQSNPKALFFKGTQSSYLSAWVCSSCGFIEFYAKSPLANPK